MGCCRNAFDVVQPFPILFNVIIPVEKNDIQRPKRVLQNVRSRLANDNDVVFSGLLYNDKGAVWGIVFQFVLDHDTMDKFFSKVREQITSKYKGVMTAIYIDYHDEYLQKKGRFKEKTNESCKDEMVKELSESIEPSTTDAESDELWANPGIYVRAGTISK